ncbi:hypothetical protein Syun_006022 [Stephania yunnanensis]|uniref:Large ribosomal subunit protein uL18 C-terminal eukaryotes domain-containing protein n=1 Tax=Stephania yunnanensis TaxID=152371 RepID=A0AAP0KVW0_9MAGN
MVWGFDLICLVRVLGLVLVVVVVVVVMDSMIRVSVVATVLDLFWVKASSFMHYVFVKAQKSRAYFKRFQVKFKRRRQGKTDYRARIRLINQDKNKYNTPKYRFVVRILKRVMLWHPLGALFYWLRSLAFNFTPSYDHLIAAYAHELPHFGLEVGLTNYAAAYCTGLLLARRVLKTLELDEEYEGNVEASGEDFSVEGALDGGLDIPHSDKRFAGFKKEDKQLDAEVHRKYIYGGHVAAYMRTLTEDEPEKYQTHFSEYVKKQIEADDLEGLYKKVHAAIRADPSIKKSEKEPPKEHRRFIVQTFAWTSSSSVFWFRIQTSKGLCAFLCVANHSVISDFRYNLKKLTYEERKAKLIERLNALNSAAGADDDEDDDE